jgi:hypothetical protein
VDIACDYCRGELYLAAPEVKYSNDLTRTWLLFWD